MQVDPIHAARLANLEGALCALLREACKDFEANEQPDAVMVRFHAEGCEVEYRRGRFVVAEEAV